MARSIDRKDLKQPDEFVSFWTRFGSFIAAHRGAVLATVIGLGAVVAAGWGGISMRESRAAQVTQDLARVERTALAEVVSDTDQKAKDPKAKEDSAVLRFKTDAERLQATVKEADAFVAAHGQDGMGRRALLIKASAQLALGQGADAEATYQQAANGELDPGLKAVALEGLALAVEATGQIDRALTLYGELAEQAQKTGGFYADRALFAKARLLEKKGQPKDAEKILREIIEKSPKTILRREIDDRLAVLESK